jgi:flagellar motor switch protein FliG
VASTLFKSLSIEEKALISSQLSEQKMMNRDMLDKFENKIRIALECFVGGENTIKHLFDDVKNEEKKSILNLLKTSQPESFHRLRKFIVTFEDLIVLSDEDMKRLIGEVNIELIAAALQNADQVLYQHFDENLTTNARAMVSEFLELKSKNITKKEIESAQEYILNIAERFDAQGVIGFKDKLNLS